jgi:hypothetical protein
MKSERNWVSAERAFLSIPGRVREIRGLQAAKAAPWVKDVFLRVSEGSEARFPENNVGKCGNVLSAAPGRDEAARAAEEAARRVLIRLEAPHPETEAFLAGGPRGAGAFPPDAFDAGAEAIALLAALPEDTARGEWIAARDAAAGESPVLLDFPAFTRSDAKDYAGRTIGESLDAVRHLTGLALPLAEGPGAAPFFARGFWAAFLRGGYQGAAYFADEAAGAGRQREGAV